MSEKTETNSSPVVRGAKIKEKKTYSTQDFLMETKKDLGTSNVKYKPKTHIRPSDAFCEAVNFEGFEESGLHAIVGKSDVGKTTIYLELIKDCMKKGIIPVLINTEDKFNWNRAMLMEMDIKEIEIKDEDTGEVSLKYEGDFIYIDKNYLKEKYKDNIEFGVTFEHVFNFIIELINKQKKSEAEYGKAPSFAFFIDSYNRLQPSSYLKGFINKDGSYKGFDELKTNNMHKVQNTNVVLTNFVDAHLKSTLTTATSYKNTMFIVLHVYAKTVMNIQTVSINGGSKIRYICDSILYMGGKAGEGSSKIQKTVKGKEFTIASMVKVEMEKSHSTTNANNALNTCKGTVYITTKGFSNLKDLDGFTKENKEQFKIVKPADEDGGKEVVMPFSEDGFSDDGENKNVGLDLGIEF